jgi:arylsulfatase A-like enzyme
LVSYTGLDRGFDSYSYRDKSEYFVDGWGDSLITKFRNHEFKEPWFLFIHLWELHEPRYIAKGFNNNKYGRNKYERALSGLDAKLGELFKYVDFNTTTVILHGDHGEKIIETMFYEYLYEFKKKYKPRVIFAEAIRKTFQPFRIDHEKLPDFAKRNYSPKKKPASNKALGHGFHLYDYAITTPLSITGNNGKFSKNRLISTQIRQIDIFPTLVEALDLHHNNNNFNIQGKSFVSLIKEENYEVLPAYFETWGRFFLTKKYWKAGLRTTKYKFIKTVYNNKAHEELYDLETDPWERKNIIKFQPHIVNVLRKQLSEIRKDDAGEIKLVGQKMTEEEEKLLNMRLKELGYVD